MRRAAGVQLRLVDGAPMLVGPWLASKRVSR
jgi:hypothetical protein